MQIVIEGLIAVALVGLLLVRQLRVRRVQENKWYGLPLVLVVIGVVQGGLVDGAHPAASVVLLVGEAVAAVALGALRASTVLVWRDEHGALWSRGSGWTVAAWGLSVASRVGMIDLGHVLGVRQGSGGLLLFLGATLLAQYALVTWRAARLARPANVVA